MPRPKKPDSPFRYFNSSPEVIRLVVMTYVRFPLSLRNVEDLLAEPASDRKRKAARLDQRNRVRRRAARLDPPRIAIGLRLYVLILKIGLLSRRGAQRIQRSKSSGSSQVHWGSAYRTTTAVHSATSIAS